MITYDTDGPTGCVWSYVLDLWSQNPFPRVFNNEDCDIVRCFVSSHDILDLTRFYMPSKSAGSTITHKSRITGS